MYCSQCGAKASGNFCYQCGGRLGPQQAGVAVEQPCWDDEIRYDVLLRIDEVRDRIARHASQAKATVSGESILELYDATVGKVLTGGLPLNRLATVVLPIYTRLGVGTGKTRRAIVARPVGHVLVATLCSFARHGQTLKQAHQAEDGCVLEATIPSDIWSFKGALVVAVRRHLGQAEVEAATKISGQFYDWGKSNRCLDTLFEDITSLAG